MASRPPTQLYLPLCVLSNHFNRESFFWRRTPQTDSPITDIQASTFPAFEHEIITMSSWSKNVRSTGHEQDGHGRKKHFSSNIWSRAKGSNYKLLHLRPARYAWIKDWEEQSRSENLDRNNCIFIRPQFDTIAEENSVVPLFSFSISFSYCGIPILPFLSIKVNFECN
jgi:hypothetical protein